MLREVGNRYVTDQLELRGIKVGGWLVQSALPDLVFVVCVKLVLAVCNSCSYTFQQYWMVAYIRAYEMLMSS